MPEFDRWYRTVGSSTGNPYQQAAERAYGPGEYVGQQGLSSRDLILWLASQAIPSGAARVLDVCCGAGAVLGQVHAHYAGRLVGVDLSLEALCQARSSIADRVTLVQSAAERLPFRGDSFDAVLFIDSLASIHQPDALLHELGRVVRSGGRLALTAEVGEPLTPAEQARFTRSEAPTILTQVQLQRLMTRAGLEPIVTHDVTAEVAGVARRLHAGLTENAQRPELQDVAATLATLGELLDARRVVECAVVAQRR